jgi:pimeloyl-ACP methyl ester carboxylesterase
MRLRRRFWWRALPLAAVLAGMPALAAPAQGPLGPHAQWYSEYLSHSRLVPIPGGRALNLYCVGSGSPTVLLESGLSESADTWWRIQPSLAKLTRVCAYDRAGYGRSPPGPKPRDTRAEVADLEAMLRSAGLRPPYVLVGHSMGGYNVRLFASRHLRETAGLVLVDSSVENQLPPLEAAIPAIAANDRRALVRTRACADPARDQKTAAACTREAPEGFPPDLAAAFVSASGLTAVQTRLAELEAFIDLNSAEVAEARTLGSLPLIVLTRGARSTDLPPDQAELEWTMWNGLHEGLVKLSTASEHRVVEGSGHYIQIDRPEAVIQAVADVLGCAKSRTAAGCPRGGRGVR